MNGQSLDKLRTNGTIKRKVLNSISGSPLSRRERGRVRGVTPNRRSPNLYAWVAPTPFTSHPSGLTLTFSLAGERGLPEMMKNLGRW